MLKDQLRAVNHQVSSIDDQILAHLRRPTSGGTGEVAALRKQRGALCREAEQLEEAHPELRAELFEEDLRRIVLSNAG
jgi:hypothetical protein